MSVLADALVVVNGPEDGTAHALIRTRVTMGSGRECDILLSQDDDVRERHAEIISTRAGFRIRCAPGASMRINGRPLGRFGSRLLQDGDIVEAGNTELMMRSLDAAGLSIETRYAGNNRVLRVVFGALGGVAATAGAVLRWAADFTRFVVTTAAHALRLLFSRPKLMVRAGVILALIAAYRFLPGIRRVVDAALFAAAEYLKFAAESISQLGGR